jgi:hypothetical protein
MKELSLNLLKLFSVWAITVFLVASCGRSAYANGVQCKITELVLADYKINIGAQSASRAFFVCNISMRSHVMVKLERDTFECAGSLCYLSANPFQLCHPYLAVNGKAPLNIGAH